jgi:protein-S-isoprenylcysteine O-methyltransferase Ste14
MLSEFLTAWFLCGCLGVFFALNLFNIIRTAKTKHRHDAKGHAEIDRPSGFLVALVAFGTVFLFLVSVAYPFLVFTGLFQSIERVTLQLHFPFDTWIQAIGIVLETGGYFLFLWSVLERGRYATSWEMREDHKLVTSGPYSYIRHPSYLAYFILFFGLFFLLLNPVALISLVAIPGYVRLTTYEEQLLVARFGSEYIEYQKRTGRFLPKIRH